MNIQGVIINGLKTGLALAATTTAIITLAGDKEIGSPWAAVNAIAHILDGDDKEQPMDFSAHESVFGITVNGAVMCAWGVLYESALEIAKAQSTVLAGALRAITAYLIDYKIVPKQFTPGIEKRLGSRSVLLTYVVLGATLAASPLWNKPRP